MVSLRKRIEKLESLRSSGIQHLSDEELDSRIAGLNKKPEFHDWLADDTDNDPLRLRINEFMAFHKDEY